VTCFKNQARFKMGLVQKMSLIFEPFRKKKERERERALCGVKRRFFSQAAAGLFGIKTKKKRNLFYRQARVCAFSRHC
jgi:hypothetical protein